MPANAERSVVVTGASSGIGRATALALARAGFQVFAGVRKTRDGDALVAEHAGIVPLQLDVTDAADIAAAARAVEDRAGGLFALVNNAGIGETAPLEYVPLEDVRRQFEVNVFGQLAVIQAFLPLLRRTRGRIVNIGSIGAHLSIPFGGVLCATKSAFRALDEALRLELHPFGLHVVLVEPASIATPAVDKTLGDAERMLARLPPAAAERYGDMLRAFVERAHAREANGSPPEVVAETVREALVSDKPRTRYLVGKDSRRLATLAATLPDRLLDRVRLRLFGLPTAFGARSR